MHLVDLSDARAHHKTAVVDRTVTRLLEAFESYPNADEKLPTHDSRDTKLTKDLRDPADPANTTVASIVRATLAHKHGCKAPHASTWPTFRCRVPSREMQKLVVTHDVTGGAAQTQTTTLSRDALLLVDGVINLLLSRAAGHVSVE